ncbi:rhomboid family intramembrane serine protease [Corynebacterium aquilae]|uniref:Peptidase S54 rhomboid domain-containing protein n=1 Tax=Corynebacterium aquilae DSM 44791 TaxID=1431546 RepID=A0A1L7CD42_9CORY|nr:rhomboid family intramembrane serine protease [Corynebacterium aquilae]APT83758.1 hypothetical protein CAQU_00120 [Corynebacterium aquilae DSM 44791]
MTTKETLKRYYHYTPATFSLVAFMVALYVITAVDAMSLNNNMDSWIGVHWGTYPRVMGELPFGPLRGLGGIVLHSGITHLLFNCFMLYLLGQDLERALSSRMMYELFFVGGLGASAFIVFLAPDAFTVGASGAIFALMVVLLALRYRMGGDYRGVLTLIAINVVWTFIGSGVSIWGHLGGLVTGAVLSLVLMKAKNARAAEIGFLGVGVVAVVAIVVGSMAQTAQLGIAGWG